MRKSVSLDALQVISRVKPGELVFYKLMDLRSSLIWMIESSHAHREVATISYERMIRRRVFAIQP